PVAPNDQPIIWAFFSPEMFPYPLIPTHRFQFDLQESPNDQFSSHTYIVEIAPVHDSWYWVTACPTEKGIKFIHERFQEGERQREKARKLSAELKEPLLSDPVVAEARQSRS